MRHNRRLNREPNEQDSWLGFVLIIIVVVCMATWWFAHVPVVQVAPQEEQHYR